MKTTKIILLTLGAINAAMFLIFRYTYILGICSIDNHRCWEYSNYWYGVFSFGPFFLISAVVASFFNRKYFTSWLRFAWWGGLIVGFFIIRVNLGVYHTPGGFFNMDDAVDRVITILVYTFFIVGSAIQLLRVYLKERKQKSP